MRISFTGDCDRERVYNPAGLVSNGEPSGIKVKLDPLSKLWNRGHGMNFT